MKLPILYPKDAPDREVLIANALRDRGHSRAVFDFIRYNLGEAAALAAILTAEQKPPRIESGAPCGCGE